jgi:Co/Zn/Cd efflux system component
MDHPVVTEIRDAVEAGNTRIADLHVWRVGKHAYACAISVVTRDQTLSIQGIRERLAVHEEIVHTTVEIHQSA